MTEILWFTFGALAGVFATLLVIVNSIKPPKPNTMTRNTTHGIKSEPPRL